MSNQFSSITIETTVHAPLQKVWEYWTSPSHITKWNSASEDWHTTAATSDLRAGGKFTSRMEAKDGSVGFDFEGIFDTVSLHKHLSYTMSDGRKASVEFIDTGNDVLVKETFDPEHTNPIEMQRAGWQAILDNFKRYTETNQGASQP